MKVTLAMYANVREAAGNTAVFGILKRNGKIYTVILADPKQSTLILIA